MIDFSSCCFCGKFISGAIKASSTEDHDAVQEDLRITARKHGWVVLEPHVDRQGRMHTQVACSIECSNRKTAHEHEERNDYHRRWWDMKRAWDNEHHEFDGPMPMCECPLITRSDGLLIQKCQPTCAYQQWHGAYIERLRNRLLALYEQWKHVPVGTKVYHRARPHTLALGILFTAGPVKLYDGGAFNPLPLVSVAVSESESNRIPNVVVSNLVLVDDTLKVFTNDLDWVVAHDEDDAWRIWERTMSERRSDYDNDLHWEIRHKPFKLWYQYGRIANIGDGELTEKTPEEWAAIAGHGWLGSTEE